jgi:PAS domain S-box-containing protein
MSDKPTYEELESKIAELSEFKSRALVESSNDEMFAIDKQELKTLNNLTSEMLVQPDLKSMYDFIAESLKKRHTDTIILFVSIDEQNKSTKFETLAGIDNSVLKKIMKITGFNPVGKTYKLKERHTRDFKSGSMIEFKGGLIEFSDSEISTLTARGIEKILGLSKIYTIGINKDESLLAAVHFFTFNKKVITESGFLEAFVKQAGLVLQMKIAENALKESEERFEALHNASFGGIAIHDKGIILECNQGLSDMTGYSYEDLIGMDGLLLIAEKSRDFVMKNILSGYEKPYEAIGVKKDGMEYPMRIEARNVPHRSKAVRTVEFRDITEQKNTELEILKAKERAEESDHLKSAFLANMSHEIRTPMNGILGFSDLLKQPNLTGEEQQKYISIIQSSGLRMLNIINDIVSISKIESGLIEVNIQAENVNDQIEYIYSFFKLEVEGKGLQFSYNNTLPSEEAIIQTDREKVFAILTNLVKNAAKYTEKGSIEFGYSKKDLFLEFYVKDTGIGVSKDRQKAIFERFIQADIVDKNAYEGAGLGLSISKAYVEMLGGEIWVESNPGVPTAGEAGGSTFYFTLPYQVETIEKSKDNIEVLATDDLTQGKNLKILIAEDDEISEVLINIMVQRFGNEIISVRTGTDAVAACQNYPDIDLVLMDIRMPEMDGYEATRQIRKFNKDVVILAQTAYALEGDKEKALSAGCNDYLSKPILAEELKNKIEKCFRQK